MWTGGRRLLRSSRSMIGDTDQPEGGRMVELRSQTRRPNGALMESDRRSDALSSSRTRHARARLVRSLLNGHPDVHIANETHYFDDLRRHVANEGPLDTGDQRVAVDYFRSFTHRPYGHFGDPELVGSTVPH